jgi:DNA repair exonuclease SbcCD ATPase subunit
MVLDINTTYFDERGGYEYAKSFFEEAYRCAVKEAGSEDYIISAVLHADERNKALSEQLGRDVYHYHLHVVYVPVVEKKLYFKKNNKNPELAGKLKEVIPQISQSNKWPLRMTAERDGKMVTLNSYSFLQDRYYMHMVTAGFDGFERGEKGSTREHLEVLEYKIKQDTERAKAAAALADEKEREFAAFDKKAANKTAQNKKLDEQLTVKGSAKATQKEIDSMGHSLPLVPGVHFTDDEAAKLKTLAKKSVTAEDRITANKKKMEELNKQISDLNAKLRDAQAEVKHWRRQYTDLLNEVKDFIGAIRKYPARLREFVTELFRPEREAKQRHEQEQQIQTTQQQQQKKTYDTGR